MDSSDKDNAGDLGDGLDTAEKTSAGKRVANSNTPLMMEREVIKEKKWYQRRRTLGVCGLVAFLVFVGAAVAGSSVFIHYAAKREAVLIEKMRAVDRKCVAELRVMVSVNQPQMKNDFIKAWCLKSTCKIHFNHDICKPYLGERGKN